MRDRQHVRFCTSSDGVRLAYATVGSAGNAVHLYIQRSRIPRFHKGHSIFDQPAMADKLLLDLAHAETEGHVQTVAAEKVVSR